MSRRTRIVATLGPATDRPGMLRAILDAGIDVARINFSHGSAGEHVERIARLREAAALTRRNVAVLADLPGPKLRVRLPAPIELAVGQEIGFSTTEAPSQANDLVITEPEIIRDVRVGQRILLDDGRLQLTCVLAGPARIVARVVAGGTLSPNKGLNLPETALTAPTLTDRDRQAIQVAAQAGVDWIALSFVRGPEAAADLRAELRRAGVQMPILAKIERPEAVERAAEILNVFDGIMVARGDMGVEIPLERVPTAQKRLIAAARAAGKPVITATDMLDSMREKPRPTRAEASDVANAIYDGTDAVMLSGETAVGDYPVESVQCMSNIAVEAERHLAELGHAAGDLRLQQPTVDDHVTQLVVELSQRVGAQAIVTPTLSGRTARLLARHRPLATIVAPSPSANVVRQMALVWGLRPLLMDFMCQPGDDRISAAVRAAYAAGELQAGALAVVLAGHPIEGSEHLPTVRLLRLAEGGTATEP